jgi:citrate lyase beta subunit
MYFKMKTLIPIITALLWLHPLSSGEVIDGVAAVVNQEIITLTDVRIVKAFQIFEEDRMPGRTNREVLQKLVERKLLLQIAGEEDAEKETDVDAAMTLIKNRLGESRFRQMLQSFGMTAEDLREYAVEAVVHKLILATRFSQAVVVSLREMKDYYQGVYLSGLEKGETPQAMMDMLDQIERAIRQERIQSRVTEWISSLKMRADIQIHMDDYPMFFK